MSHPSPPPQLTPQFCFNQTALRDFLRLSRASIDDSIVQNLNALITPAASSFDPSSTSTRQIRPASHGPIDLNSCRVFKDKVLFPSWQARSDLLTYCASVATSPDPDDPDSVLRQLESAKARDRVVDERLDPYSGRYFPREARTEVLAALIRNERSVERIIRARSWALVEERCAESMMTADEALDEWRIRQENTNEGA
ncbi:hypothetical protein K432DRAFT_341301 [Lepidopterella palustris CBS 459.81]|uniref:Caffeine-induced death protein Cid2 n=1 Tax=Lepidopterella palustris CBS 459.81 TaxID=1314670 RepID=A0A8E2EM83_9PEZI|nr:hypothetical protein K432DRAFT_341301 [Lepidopterella palustris CBS 459.81]